MNKLLADRFEGQLGKGSMIRKMFEIGLALKEKNGEDSVCDFSIGNPDVPPPAEVKKAMHDLADKADQPFAFGYMAAAGYPWLLKQMAEFYSKEQGIKVEPGEIFIATGAAGSLSSVFRATLNPGDEVLGLKPYFGEYDAFMRNTETAYVGIPLKADFTLDMPAIEKAINKKTRIFLINSPHNPTGKIFNRGELEELVKVLRKKSDEFGRPILLLADEPYRALVYGNEEVPSVLPMYEWSVVVGSFAKNISLPGERVGYVICCPNMPDKAGFMQGIAQATRIMGYVNAPAVGQQLLKTLLDKKVDLNIYARRREAMAKALKDAGYEFVMPGGAFYFFPKAPIADDIKFVEEVLAKYGVLGVAGTAFGMPGYFRLSFCVSEEVIKRSAPGFKKAMEDAKKMK
jgi:aspartate aminotransferase